MKMMLFAIIKILRS